MNNYSLRRSRIPSNINFVGTPEEQERHRQRTLDYRAKYPPIPIHTFHSYIVTDTVNPYVSPHVTKDKVTKDKVTKDEVKIEDN